MAAGDVTVTLSISGTTTANETVRPFSQDFVVSSVKSVFDRTLDVPTSVQDIVKIVSGTETGDTIDALNCIAVKNTAASGGNYVTLGVKDTSAKSAYYRVNAGEMFLLMRDQFDADGATGAAFAEFNSIDTITLQANTAAVVCQIVAF